MTIGLQSSPANKERINEVFRRFSICELEGFRRGMLCCLCGGKVNIFDEKKFNINLYTNSIIYIIIIIYIFISNGITISLLINICYSK